MYTIFYGLSTSYLDYMLPVFNLIFSPCIPMSNSVHFTGLALIYGGLMGGCNFFSVDVNLDVCIWCVVYGVALGVYILFYLVILKKLVVGI